VDGYSRQKQMCIGTPIANRNRAEIEGLIGFFVNTLVMRADLRGNPTVKELLERVRQTALGAYAYQDLPFEQLVEELEPERDLSRSPVFQVMFALQNAPVDELELAGLKLETIVGESEAALFDLTLNLMEYPGGLAVTIEYNSDLYEEGTIRRLAGHYEQILHRMAEGPEERAEALPMLEEAERRQLLVEWNETTKKYPEQSLAELFQQQVESRGGAPAVVCEGESLSYEELNRR